MLHYDMLCYAVLVHANLPHVDQTLEGNLRIHKKLIHWFTRRDERTVGTVDMLWREIIGRVRRYMIFPLVDLAL